MYNVTPPSENRLSVYPPSLYKVILSFCTMIDKYKKLVVIAEAMAMEWNEKGFSLDSFNVKTEWLKGTVTLGSIQQCGSTYCPDDNVHYPVEEMVYMSVDFKWNFRDEKWEEVRYEKSVPQATVIGYVEEPWDELPF
jgi:hypothetical protein